MYDSVNCNSCEETKELTGIEPDCIDGECQIPKISARIKMLYDMRNALVSLNGIITNSDIIIKAYGGLSKEDLEVLMIIERTIAKYRSTDK